MSTFRVELKKVVDDSYDIAVGYDLQSRFMEDIKSGLAASKKKGERLQNSTDGRILFLIL